MKKFIAEITVVLRKGILDVQGKTVEQALHSMGLTKLSDVSIGKFSRITVLANDVSEAEAHIKTACEKLISNPVMEDYSFTLSEVLS